MRAPRSALCQLRRRSPELSLFVGIVDVRPWLVAAVRVRSNGGPENRYGGPGQANHLPQHDLTPPHALSLVGLTTVALQDRRATRLVDKGELIDNDTMFEVLLKVSRARRLSANAWGPRQVRPMSSGPLGGLHFRVPDHRGTVCDRLRPNWARPRRERRRLLGFAPGPSNCGAGVAAQRQEEGFGKDDGLEEGETQ